VNQRERTAPADSSPAGSFTGRRTSNHSNFSYIGGSLLRFGNTIEKLLYKQARRREEHSHINQHDEHTQEHHQEQQQQQHDTWLDCREVHEAC